MSRQVCPQGHRMTPENVFVTRICKRCHWLRRHGLTGPVRSGPGDGQHCRRGHPFSDGSVWVTVACRTCHRERGRRAREQAAAAWGQTVGSARARQSCCRRGHPFDAANTWVSRAGRRHCRTCNRERQRDRAARR